MISLSLSLKIYNTMLLLVKSYFLSEKIKREFDIEKI